MIRFINSVISNNNFLSTNCCGPEKSLVIFNSILSENGYNSNFNPKLSNLLTVNQDQFPIINYNEQLSITLVFLLL